MSQAQQINATDVGIEQNTVRALDLRRRGKSYRQIADTLDVSMSTAHGYVRRGLEMVRETAAETAEEVKQLELERLDDLYDRLRAKLEAQVVKDEKGVEFFNPDEATVRAMLDVMKRRADLLGLDAPKKSEIGGPDGAPIAVATYDGRDVLMQRLEEVLRRRGSVVVPDAALEVGANPALVSPELSQNGGEDAAEAKEPMMSGPSSNGNGHRPLTNTEKEWDDLADSDD